MKRSLLAVVVAGALALTACSTVGTTAAPKPSGHRTRAAKASTAVTPLPVGNPAVNTTRDPIVNVVRNVQPAIVNVTTDLFQNDPLGGSQQGQGVGTGFIVRSDSSGSTIVTNYHVVEQAQRITVITPPPGTHQYDARVIGGDQTADLAVLHIDAPDLQTVPIGHSSSLQLGQRVVAMGYALALKGGPTVTSGIVSALGRTIQAQDPNCQQACGQNQSRTYHDVIQTDAAINPGNSGGPLLNLAGQVVGINTAGNSTAENIGFAIALDAARPIIEHAVSAPGSAVAYLGVVSQDVTPSLAFQFNLPVKSGAYIVNVAPGGPAEKGGIRSGDVIVGFDGKTVDGSRQLGDLIRSKQPGDHVSVEVVGRGGRHTVDVTLGTNPLPTG